MHLKTRNVNTAFHELVQLFHRGTTWAPPARLDPINGSQSIHTNITRQSSRNGPVLMIDEPVIVTYTDPKERVLFNQARDANPFFHLYESLWMLAGRNDVEPLAYYASKMKDYSDDGTTLNGAYGYRWRECPDHDYGGKIGSHDNGETLDQLDILVNHLKADPSSRRAVLQMWNVEDDLLKIGCKTCDTRDKTMFFRDPGPCPICGSGYRQRGPASKDVCCNLSVMFSIREDTVLMNSGDRDFSENEPYWTTRYLDMTVVSRSEDLIWGLLGADYVDFTILQEYMAARLGVEVGLYHHMINNLHVYESNWKPKEWLNAEKVTLHSDYSVGPRIPLIKNPEIFKKELQEFVELHSGKKIDMWKSWCEPFLNDVAQPMLNAFHFHRMMNDDIMALDFMSRVKADDWKIVGTKWIKRRM